MDTLLQQFLNQLKSNVYQMAGLVEEAILISTKALAKKSAEDLPQVFELETKINQFHKKVDHESFKLLARQSPVASDLRLIIVSTKMSVDLERMGDLACTISYSLKDYLKGQPLFIAAEIPQMADVVRLMVRKGLDAFMQGDRAMATEVLEMDEVVDRYRDQLVLAIRQAMKEGGSVDSGMELFTIVRNLERLGDHATNIAEEVIFLISGEDVRHPEFLAKNQTGGGSQ